MEREGNRKGVRVLLSRMERDGWGRVGVGSSSAPVAVVQIRAPPFLLSPSKQPGKNPCGKCTGDLRK